MILHGFYRSTASWRVRIALGLKGLSVEHRPHHLRKGEQRSASYLAINPQGLVPSLILDEGQVLTQSLAIIEYLDELFPEPALLPKAPLDRARVRAMAQLIACDLHPVQNLKILERVRGLAGSAASDDWARATIEEGLEAFECMMSTFDGPFCFGSKVTLADLALIPQLGNARRFGIEVKWPKIAHVENNCLKISAFKDAVPERQNDREVIQ